MLAVVGDLLEDIVVRIDTAPALGTDTPATIERRRGGSAANVAAAASIGGRARFIGRVGDDQLGDRLVDELTRVGVDVRVQRAGRTGSVVVLVGPDGERTMLPDRSAATELAAVDAAWLDGVRWVHVPAYSLLCEPIGTSTLQLIGAVDRDEVSVSVDVSSVAVVEHFGVTRFVEVLDEIGPDLVFANAPESLLVPMDRPWLTVVKHGPDPVTVAGVPGEPGRISIPMPCVADVMDTTGAGDAFAAGYLVAAMAGADVRESVAAAGAMAAETITRRSSPRGG